jgi:phosphatidate cytidylyltransferase
MSTSTPLSEALSTSSAPTAPAAPKAPSNLALRLISAAVLLPVVITCFVYGGWAMRGLVLLAGAAALFEYGAVVAKADLLARGIVFVTGMAAALFGIVVGADGGGGIKPDPALGVLVLQSGFMVVAALFVLRPGTDLVVAFRNFAFLVFGLLWIVPGLVAVSRLRDLGDALPAGSPPAAAGCFILAAMVATWSNDTCAYFAGRLLGKHKMAGPISPKKTWEGFVGGAIGTPLFLLGGRALFPAVFAPLTTVDIIVLSLPVAILGPIGDLTESLWKRAFDVKDSGNLIPGHGGMLDRIDAVFFVAPWVLTYFVVVKPLFG